MNDPRNDFENFFDADNHPSMNIITPPPAMLLQAVVRIVATNPQWYRDRTLRLLISSGLSQLTSHVTESIEAGKEPEITLTESALCMMIAERLDSSRRFASDEENRLFPATKMKQDNED